jgi:hypothetical protein
MPTIQEATPTMGFWFCLWQKRARMRKLKKGSWAFWWRPTADRMAHPFAGTA